MLALLFSNSVLFRTSQHAHVLFKFYLHTSSVLGKSKTSLRLCAYRNVVSSKRSFYFVVSKYILIKTAPYRVTADKKPNLKQTLKSVNMSENRSFCRPMAKLNFYLCHIKLVTGSRVSPNMHLIFRHSTRRGTAGGKEFLHGVLIL